MTGFVLLAGLYLLCWAGMLGAGAVVLVRSRERESFPPDLAPDRDWAVTEIHRFRRGITQRVDAHQIPLGEVTRRFRRVATPAPTGEVLAVRGPVEIPAHAVATDSLLVEGDLHLAQGSVVLGGVVVGGELQLGVGARIAGTVVATRGIRLAEGAVLDAPAWTSGTFRIGARAKARGGAGSDTEVILDVGGATRAAYAPLVRCVGPIAEAVRPPVRVRRMRPPLWTPELDDALAGEWPQGRLAEIVDRLAERTGAVVRGVHIMARARALGLFASGLPQRPAVLGGRAAWLLAPETVRVGSDLQVPPGAVVSYSLVVEGAVEVFEDAELEAAVRSGRGFLLRSGAVAHAQVASDGLVVCEEGSAIRGPVDSSASVLLFANVRVGSRPGFWGCHAQGYIGLEPGAVVRGPAVAGVEVRGEPLRPRSGGRGEIEQSVQVEDGAHTVTWEADDPGEARADPAGE